MTYAHMNHALWVENNRPHAVQIHRPRKDDRGNVLGWHSCPPKLSPFQETVINIIGISLGGIYNAPIVWNSVDWGEAHSTLPVMHVPLHEENGLATFDSSSLTLLVLSCHHARIRLCIGAHGVKHLGLNFSRRRDVGPIYHRHPDVNEAVTGFKAYVGEQNPIRYRGS